MSKIILKLTGTAAREAACRYVHDAPDEYEVHILQPDMLRLLGLTLVGINTRRYGLMRYGDI